ncbi:MAG: 4Fe-4S double cluster binding domain-containing protein [Phycisphaerae bacterium]
MSRRKKDNPAIGGQLRAMLLASGAANVAYGDLRGLPEAQRQGLPFGVSIGVALDARIVDEIRDGPTLEYQAEYHRANALLNKLAAEGEAVLRDAGFRASAIPATVEALPADLSTTLPHKTVATRAGVGWIGKTALLVTERFGSAIRFSSILTDAPLPCAAPQDESRCGDCRLCMDACPARASTGRAWRLGLTRDDIIDVRACLDSIRRRMPIVGLTMTICGICISACPRTRACVARSLGRRDIVQDR